MIDDRRRGGATSRFVTAVLAGWAVLSAGGHGAQGATVIWQTANTRVICDQSPSELENPVCTENVAGACKVLEWIDAQHTPNRGRWRTNGIGTFDGTATELWIRDTGGEVSTCTAYPSNSVAVHLVGDDNDGLATILVDGVPRVGMDMWSSPSADSCLVFMTGLDDLSHEIVVRADGVGAGGGNHNDVAVFGASACGPEHLRVCFYSDCDECDCVVGHAYLQLFPPLGPQGCQRNLAYGLYPKKKWCVGTFCAGQVKYDRTRSWEWRICYPIDRWQYNAIANGINYDFENPPPYTLIGNNCTAYITQKTANGACCALPRTLTRHGYPTPKQFCVSMKDIGQGGTYFGGRVESNRCELSAGSGAGETPADAPSDYDYEGVVELSHSNPSSLANIIGLTSSEEDLGTFSVRTGDSLVVNLSCTMPGDPDCVTDTNAIISVDWGDGSELDVQSLSYTHPYTASGTYPGSIAIVDGSTVRRYAMSVNVSAMGMTEQVAVGVPPAATGNVENTGFDTGELPLQLQRPLPLRPPRNVSGPRDIQREHGR